MKLSPLLTVLAALASVMFCSAPYASAQVANDPATREKRPVIAISFADGKSLTTFAEGGLSDLVALQPDEVVNIQLNFSLSAAKQRVVVQSLDGGFASGTKNTVDADGTLNITFQAGASPGLNRILVINQDTSSILRFWVINTSDPTANPSQLH
jgi:hypothetical protein